MFLIKKLVSPFFHPLPGLLFLALIGICLLWLTRKQKTGKTLATLGVLGLAFFSYGQVAHMLAAPLEREYRPISDVRGLEEVRWIVVLSGRGAC